MAAGIWECAFFQIFSRETSSRASDLYGKRLHEMDQEERSQQVYIGQHLSGNWSFQKSAVVFWGTNSQHRILMSNTFLATPYF